jgi:DNA-binding NarL/FixJ family response regulator
VLAYFAQIRPVAPQVFPSLTDRERDILYLLAQGKSNAAIATELSLSVKTIANNVSNIFSKLQVADRSEAIVRARDAGFVS